MRSICSDVKNISQAPDTHLWTPLFQKWTEFVERYVDINNGGDAPYWYNERASLSLLTGAAWGLGYIALDEFGTEKAKGNPDETGYGRCDAWISTKTHELSLEAKQLHEFVSYTKLEVAAEKVGKSLNFAYDDAEKVIYKEGARAGISFFSPCFSKKEWDDIGREQFIDSLISAITAGNPDADFIAWSFPEQANSLTSDKGSFKDKVFPGTIAILKFVN